MTPTRGFLTPRSVGRLLALTVGCLGLALSAQAAATPPVVANAALVDDGDSATLSFELSAPLEATARPVLGPGRIVIDLPEVNFQLDAHVGTPDPRPGALVKAYRFGLLEPGKSRISVELARPACIARFASQPLAAGAAGARVSLQLKYCDGSVFAAAAKEAPPVALAAASSSAPTPAPAHLPVIVLDPGHGGSDSGASGVHGAVEKSITLDYAMELKRQLEATHHFKVALTRADDSFVSLEDRVQIARDADAALMISIHADILPGAGADVSGATVYTCSDRASDAVAARIAERENAADKAGGLASPADNAGVADILFDLKRRETRAYAHLFSRALVSQWRGVARLSHNPERSAGFVVLKAPDFPSVLVELGFVSNAQDVASMTSPEWRAQTAASMTAAVERFMAGKFPAGDGGESGAVTPAH